MLQPLTGPPPHITAAEHDTLTSSTPASFADIPPVLRWTDTVRVQLDPAGLTGSTGAAGEPEAVGVLWVTEDAVSFLIDGRDGWTLSYPSLTLHAQVGATDDRPAHIYCQVDESDAPAPFTAPTVAAGAVAPANGHNASGEVGAEVGDEDEEEEDGFEGEEEEFGRMREIRIFLPEDKLVSLFAALSSCSALHDSLLPSGEPNSFFGGGMESDMGMRLGMGDEDGWIDVDDEEGGAAQNGAFEDADDAGDAEGDEGEENAGRVDTRIRFETLDSTAREAGEGEGEGEDADEEDEVDEEGWEETTDTAVITDPRAALTGFEFGLGSGTSAQGEVEVDPDALASFLAKLDWGDVPRPAGWEE